jgi:pyruvate kinase
VSFPRIVCTLGTTTDNAGVVRGMVDAGMGLARINSAYASLEELRQRTELALPLVPVMLDLKGPQLRVDCTTDKTDAAGHTVTVPCRYPIATGEVICVGFGRGPVRFNHDFSDDLEIGDLVTFDNGTIRTRVVDGASRGLAEPDHGVLLEVLDAGGGKMTPQMGANVPGKALHVPHLSERDRQVLAMGVEHKVPWFALSFVRDADDVRALDDALGPAAAGIIVKIEEQLGIDHLEPIVGAVWRSGRECAVMIARGDLFVELPPAKLPRIQADLLRRCHELEVPAIVATGLLLSMQHGPRPARSEVCDVAFALQSGADSLMLSDETSNGKDPVTAVKMLAELVGEYGGRHED